MPSDQQPGTVVDEVCRTVYLGELTAAQVKAAAEWVATSEDADTVRFYLLDDGSVDVHQGDGATNIDPDGTDNG